MATLRPSSVWILASLAAPLAAQAVPLAAPFDVPIHAVEEGPVLWASRTDYKVGFGADGPTFYPVLGAGAPEHLPVGWQTVAVTAGGTPLPFGGTVRRHTDWRCDYDRGSFGEFWAARAEGLEQGFVIRQLPAAGDLRIRGRLGGALRAKPSSPTHGAIDLIDGSGRAVVRYGAAFAFDAAGRKTEVTTAVDGDELELRVDGSWLARASLPVVVDPLLSAGLVSSGTASVVQTAVAHDAIRDELLFVFVRAVTSTDRDVYAHVTPSAFGGSYVVYSDVIATRDSRNPSCAFVGETRRFVLAFDRGTLGGTDSGIWVAVVPSGSRTRTSAVLARAPVPGTAERRPAVGGTYAQNPGIHALITYELEAISAPQLTRVYASRFDTSGVVWQGAPVALSPSGIDAERPAVNQTSLGGSAPWLVVWQEYENRAGDDLEVHGALVRPNGTAGRSQRFGSITPGDHSYAPKVAGIDGRYLIAFVGGRNGGTVPAGTFGTRIVGQRIDWHDPAAGANFVDFATLRSSGGGILGGIGVDGVAFDEGNRSHWTLLVRDQLAYLNAVRVGYRMSVAENAYVNDGGLGGASASGITYRPQSDFAIGFGTSASPPSVYGRLLVDPSVLPPLPYGTSCGASLATFGRPWAGNEFFGFDITAPSPGLAFVAISLARASVPLGGIGMGTCSLNVDPSPGAWIGLLPAGLAGGGATTFRLPVPLPAPLSGSIDCQAITSGPTPLGLVASRGLEVRIR